MKNRFFLIVLSVLVAAGGAGMFLLYPLERLMPLKASVSPVPFTELDVNFEHNWQPGSWPLTGAAVLDLKGKDKYSVFVGGGKGQEDALLVFSIGQVINVIGNRGISERSATYGATAVDINDDGNIDLLVARHDGVWVYYNDGKGYFDGGKLELNLADNAVPLHVTVNDIDADGDLDLFVSTFLKPEHYQPRDFSLEGPQNILLENTGDRQFKDITKDAGLTEGFNTYTAGFAELNGQPPAELVLANDAGPVRVYSRPSAKAAFSQLPTPDKPGYYFGFASGDYDNDGDTDLIFSNIGISLPDFIAKGNAQGNNWRRDWLVLANDGHGQFTDVTRNSQLDGLALGMAPVLTDINQDGQQDLVATQNHPRWFWQKLRTFSGKAMLNQDGRFYQLDGWQLSNSHAAASPVLTDIDGNNVPDVIWLNIGGKLRAHVNRYENDYLTVRLPDNARFDGVEVRVTTEKGTLVRHRHQHTGARTDSLPDIHFGLTGQGNVKSVTLTLENGETMALTPAANRLLTLDDVIE